MSKFSDLKNSRVFKDAVARAVLLLVCGLVLTISPWLSAQIVLRLGAAALILYGAYQVFRYFRQSVDAGQGLFARGLIAASAGLIALITPYLVLELVPTLIGFVLTAIGIGDLENAVSMKRRGLTRWHVALVFALVVVALGALIIVNPFFSAMSLIRFIGISMMITAALELVSIWGLNQ